MILSNNLKEILLVDDRKENLELLNSFLKNEGYQTRVAINGKIALLSVKARKPDLILLDIEMPGMDGYAVSAKLKSDKNTADIPIIFVSAHSDTDAKVKSFQVGAVDFIAKPLAKEEVLARVKTHLELSDYRHELEKRIEDAISEVTRLNSDLVITQKEMTFALSSIMETRDDDTGRHVMRVAAYAKLLALLYGLPEEDIKLIYEATPFHDAGKVAIPDSILNKPGKLTPQEWDIMTTHTTKGHMIFKDATRPLLKTSAIIAKEHHERWDGSGYPEGLKGEEIHIMGRIVALSDVLDALTNERVYKRAWSFDEAAEYIASEKGKMFDPKLVELFLEYTEQFRQIYTELKD